MRDTRNFIAIRKLMLIAAICIAVAAAAVCLYNFFDLKEKLENLDALGEWINSKGVYAIPIYAALVLASVIFLPIPSTVLNYLATVIFDHAWVTFLVTAGVTLAGSFICYFLGKVFGKRIVIWLAGKEKTEKYSRIINENGKFLFVMMLLLPFFPDDVICLLAGASSMSLTFFSVSVILARPVMIALVSFLGKSATDAMDTWGIPVAAAVAAIVVAFAVLVIVFRFRHRKKESAAHDRLNKNVDAGDGDDEGK